METGARPPDLPPFQTVVDTFVAPSRAMATLRAAPRLVVPLLVTMLAAVLFAIAGATAAQDTIVDSIRESSELDAETRDRMSTFVESHPVVMATVFATLSATGVLLTVLFWSALLHAGSTMTFAERPEGFSFWHTFSVTLHANLVNIPHLAIQTLFFRDATLSLSLAGLLGLGAGTPAGVALAWVAPFNLWWLFLLGLGVSRMFDAPLGRAIWVPVAISLGLRVLQVAVTVFGGGAPA